MKFWSMPAGLFRISQMGRTIRSRQSSSLECAGASSTCLCTSQRPFKHQHFVQLETLLLAMIFKHKLWSHRALYPPFFHCSRPRRMVSERRLAGQYPTLQLVHHHKFKLSLKPTSSLLSSTFFKMQTSKHVRRHAGPFQMPLLGVSKNLRRFVILYHKDASNLCAICWPWWTIRLSRLLWTV